MTRVATGEDRWAKQCEISPLRLRIGQLICWVISLWVCQACQYSSFPHVHISRQKEAPSWKANWKVVDMRYVYGMILASVLSTTNQTGIKKRLFLTLKLFSSSEWTATIDVSYFISVLLCILKLPGQCNEWIFMLQCKQVKRALLMFWLSHN